MRSLQSESGRSLSLKGRIVVWAGAGFVVACGWILFAFLTPPEYLTSALRKPLVETVAIASCPIVFAGRYVPLPFWAIPPVNAATYTVIGLIVEMLRRKSTPRMAA